MKDAGFDFSKVILVTDRGYQSLINIQKQIDLEVKFIQGIRLSEDIVKRSFDRYDASLHNQRFYDTGERVYAHSTTEAWKQYTDYGSLNKTLHLHLYRFPKADEAEMEELRLQVQQVLDLKNANKQVPPEKWLTYKRFVCERTTAQGHRYWDRDDNAIEPPYAMPPFCDPNQSEANPFQSLKTSIGCAAKLSRISINLKTGSMGIDCGVRIRLTGANCWCARWPPHCA